MGFTFENIGTNTYLVYAVSSDESIDTLSLGMLTNNRINGLAVTQFTQMDSQRFIKYNVSAHVSVKQFFTGLVNKKRLIGVFRGIVDAMLSAEDYMIDTSSLLMDPEYIFTDVSTCETVMICLPIVGDNKGTYDLGTFLKNIIYSAQFDPTENCDYVAKIINYLNSNSVVVLDDFKNLLLGIDGKLSVNAQQAISAQPNVQSVGIAPNSDVQHNALQQPIRPVDSTGPKPAMQHQQTIAQQNQATPVIKPVGDTPKMAVPQKTYQGTNGANRMAVPPKASDAMQKRNEDKQETEKEISFLYLMQHYNKENAAAYKAQKEAKKVKKASTPSIPLGERSSGAFTVPGAPKIPQSQPVQFKYPGTDFQPDFSIPKQQNATGINAADQMSGNASQQFASKLQQVSQEGQPQSQPVISGGSLSNGNFGETTVLGGSNSGETTVLGTAGLNANPRPYLIRTKYNERIFLDKPVFRIGKEKSYVDYFIGDNTAISRSHANIITREESCFAVDTNSTNHTYINGKMIQSNTEIKLNHGDKIRLANEDFEFKLY